MGIMTEKPGDVDNRERIEEFVQKAPLQTSRKEPGMVKVVQVKLPKEVWMNAKFAAIRSGISLHDYLVGVISKSVKSE